MAKNDFKMVDYSQNKNIVYALKTRKHQVKDSINVTYDIVDQIFEVLDEEDISVKQIIPCLTFHPSDLEKLHPDFSEEGKEEMPTGYMSVFYKNLGITPSIYLRKLF